MGRGPGHNPCRDFLTGVNNMLSLRDRHPRHRHTSSSGPARADSHDRHSRAVAAVSTHIIIRPFQGRHPQHPHHRGGEYTPGGGVGAGRGCESWVSWRYGSWRSWRCRRCESGRWSGDVGDAGRGGVSVVDVGVSVVSVVAMRVVDACLGETACC